MNQIAFGGLKAVTPVGPGNQRALAKQRTREKILAAATELFAARGYEGATIRDIAKAAGMSTGAVFASFTDKSDLFGEIVAAEQQALQGVMRAAGAERTGQGAIVAMLDAAAHRHLADLALFQATMSAIWTPGLGPDVRRRVSQRPTAALIAGALKTAPCADVAFDRNLVAEMIWDSYTATLRRAALEGLTLEDVKTRVADQVSLILAGARRRGETAS
jgi:AcrR family transcriptional regulator